MVTLSHSQQQPPQIQLQNLIFDGLYCEEERFDEVLGSGLGFEQDESDYYYYCDKKSLTLLENDLFWEDEELVSLLSKEKEAHLGNNRSSNLDSDGLLMVARKEGVGWMLRVIGHYGFTPMTAVLAVSYYDRFISSLCFQRDKPWMSQLAAVACLSIAAKVEEIQVPLLLDFQVESAKFVFEAKTIQRMELLVLSTLQWKMKLVTPLSFIDHIVRRFGLMTNRNLEFLKRCEDLLLSVIADAKLVHYLPSVIASATMLIVVKDIDPCRLMEYQNQLMDALKVSKETINECYKLILEIMDDQGNKHYQNGKRKHQPIPGSPNGVVDAYFSCDSSNDSWDVVLSASPSKQMFKRSRVQDKLMML
ncbi:cyclin-D3-1 [Coffea eugenioides]|uniref:Cyclin-D3-2 n=1 Tax=Coffea arabica TaxID=13443 RepID=A0A6P6TFJ1_COFAR|nr:cyclin-D3-1-like [Coffea arabica]XP_027151142.1 cyclin-D3-1 [Coffea eugenioides]